MPALGGGIGNHVDVGASFVRELRGERRGIQRLIVRRYDLLRCAVEPGIGDNPMLRGPCAGGERGD